VVFEALYSMALQLKKQLLYPIALLALMLLALPIVYFFTPTTQRRLLERLVVVPCGVGAEAVADARRLFAWQSIGIASVDPNLWGLQRYEGSDLVKGYARAACVPGGPLYFETRLHADIGLNPWDVVAYHEVIYGLKPWGVDPTHPAPREPLVLPLRVAELPRVVALASFSIGNASTGFNIAYDLWLKRRPDTSGAKQGDMEVMVWLHWRNATPAGIPVKVFEVPTVVNGKLEKLNWSAWLQRSVGEGWVYIAFTPPEPLSGEVAVDLSHFVGLAGQVLREELGWARETVDNLYLMSVELGSEVFFSRSISLSWRLDRYLLYAFHPWVKQEEALLEVAAEKR